jgi:hypothetical protein
VYVVVVAVRGLVVFEVAAVLLIEVVVPVIVMVDSVVVVTVVLVVSTQLPQRTFSDLDAIYSANR